MILNEQEAVLFERARCFIDGYGFKPLAVEQQMTSDKLRLGGTLDAVGTFAKKFWENDTKFWGSLTKVPFYTTAVWATDWKISNQFDDLNPLQLFGYRELYRETTGVEVDHGVIVRISKGNDAPLVECRGYWLPDYEEEFYATRRLWEFQNREGKWAGLRKRARRA